MNIQIIIGSTRPGRVSPQIAQWVFEHVPKNSNTTYELVDVADYNLPLYDEPMHPMMAQYSHDHTKKWSAKIAQADGYIFVTAEYNGGVPSSLKNALDYLYQEWTAKPAMIVSYGVGGGISASGQLQQSFAILKMKTTGTAALTITRAMSRGDGQLRNPEVDFKPYETALLEATDELLNNQDVNEAFNN